MCSSPYTRLVGRPGFTLMEVLVALSLAALATALFTPHLRTFSRRNETAAAAREMMLCMRSAHWKAILSGCRVRLSTFSRKGDPALRYVIEKDEDGLWIPEAVDHRIPEGVLMRATGPGTKIFNPDGTSSMGSVILEGAGGASYRLALNPLTGRVRFYRGGTELIREK